MDTRSTEIIATLISTMFLGILVMTLVNLCITEQAKLRELRLTNGK